MRFAKAMPAMIQVRVSREEKRRLIRAAREQNLTLSDLVRVAALRRHSGWLPDMSRACRGTNEACQIRAANRISELNDRRPTAQR